MPAETIFEPDVARIDRFVRVGGSLPATCRRGELFFLVGATNKIYASFSTNTWTEIANSGGGAATVESVFGRTGAVVAVADDYSFDEVDAGTSAKALVIGTGGSLVVSGTGSITASAAIIKTTAAPADGALAAGELAIWLDPDNTTPAVMFKAKKTNGSVVTASVLLT